MADGNAPASTVDDTGVVAARAMMLCIGRRLLEARKAAGLSRRALSERSGVSPRYIAQLEAGEGNASIALLYKVGVALNRPVDWFVSERDLPDDEALEVARMFGAAPETAKTEVRRILDAAIQSDSHGPRVALIGLRGAGKSTLGRRAGETLAVPFVELNDEIEARSGLAIPDVMALYGPDGYRAMEQEALAKVLERDGPVILAVAGGIVGSEESFSALCSNCFCVWLRTSPEEHMSRVRAQGDTRPMAGNPRALDELRRLLSAREALYGRADAILDTAGMSEDESLEELIRIIGRRVAP